MPLDNLADDLRKASQTAADFHRNLRGKQQPPTDKQMWQMWIKFSTRQDTDRLRKRYGDEEIRKYQRRMNNFARKNNLTPRKLV